MTQNNLFTQKPIGVININQIKNWKAIKGDSIYLNINLTNSLYPDNADHFIFGFEAKFSTDLLNFFFSLLDGKGDLINFASNEQNIPIIGFTISRF